MLWGGDNCCCLIFGAVLLRSVELSAEQPNRQQAVGPKPQPGLLLGHCAGHSGSLALALSSFAEGAGHEKHILSQAAFLSIPCHLELDLRSL